MAAVPRAEPSQDLLTFVCFCLRRVSGCKNCAGTDSGPGRSDVARSFETADRACMHV
jgi:hypothetical protein